MLIAVLRHCCSFV